MGVTQDPVQERTELTLQAIETGAARYQYGWTVINASSDYMTLYLETTDGIGEGETVYFVGGSAEIVSADYDDNYIVVDTPVMATAIWYDDDPTRFLTATDRLG